MDGVDGIRTTRRRRTLKERLGLKNMGCCGGATWGFRPTTINISESEDEERVQEHPEQQQQQQHHQSSNQSPLLDAVQVQSENSQAQDCNGRPLINGGMNLAAALAAERHLRAVEGINVVGHTNNVNSNVDPTGTGTAPGTPLRVSLMRLLAETDGCDGEEKAGGGEMGNDSMCCVCMGRKKGAAFIPCGHTFCRLCSREMWLNRGSCPLCNRSILEILDIF